MWRNRRCEPRPVFASFGQRSGVSPAPTWGRDVVVGFGAFALAVARFGRLTAAGLGMSCVVIGHATGGAGLPLVVLIGLLLVGLMFHVVAFALNDIYDLELDRTEPTRALSPLVAGQISPLGAGLIVAATCAASFVVDLLFFGLSGPRSGSAGTVALAAGYACLAFYDAFSKRLPVPLVADTVQGVGWACLVWYGGVRAGGATAATLLAGLFVIGFVVIVNAVHGGIRDLHNDSTRGARTAAIAFGARVVGDGVSVPRRLRALAWLLQGALALVALLSPLGVRGGFGLWAVWYLLCLATTAAAVLLLREGLRSVDRTQRFLNIGAAHILALWLPLTAMTAMYGGLGQGLISLLAMALPMLGNGDFRAAFRALPGVVSELASALPRLGARRSTGAAETQVTESAATQSSGADRDVA
jgi:4-hydroxybenzoate polyprenyltransferase